MSVRCSSRLVDAEEIDSSSNPVTVRSVQAIEGTGEVGMDWPATIAEDPATMDEHRLIERAKDGDLSAFEALYRAHVARVYALCLRLWGDPEGAEEIVQDVFVKLWTKIGTFKGNSAFSSWLHRLAVNRTLDRIRSERRRNAWEVDDENADERPDASGGSTTPETRLALERAIRSLPDGARTVLVLHDIEGFRHDEIAELTGIATGTSKAQIHRARKLLRERMK